MLRAPQDLDRRQFLAALGGAATVGLMSPEQRAEALEHYQAASLEDVGKPALPTVAELEQRIESRPFRRGVGDLFVASKGDVTRLASMPEAPTLFDFFDLRWASTRSHCLQSATHALKQGHPEEIVFACLLHDTVQALVRTDHGWWGAQLFAPYVSERVGFAIRYHSALRFFADPSVGYEYPDLYKRIFGDDYVPPRYVEETYLMVRRHKWYMLPRLVTVNDLYAFDPNARPSLEPFTDIIGRHFKQPKRGLGYDSSTVAHMWRTMAHPDTPL